MDIGWRRFVSGCLGWHSKYCLIFPSTLIALLGLSVATTGSAHAVSGAEGVEGKKATEKVAGKEEVNEPKISRMCDVRFDFG